MELSHFFSVGGRCSGIFRPLSRDRIFLMAQCLVHKGKDGLNISELLVNHETKDAHLSGTALVELNGALLSLPVIGLLVPAEVNEAIAEVALELRLPSVLDSLGVLLGAVGGLHESDGGDELGPDHTGDGGKGIEATGDVLGTGEANTGGGGQVTNDGKHGNTAVL